MDDSHDRAAALNAASPGTLMERMGIEFLEARPGRVVARMPVAGNTQPYGLLHGGASVVLAETVGSIAAGLHAHPGTAVGTEVNASHHRAVRSGHVTATATPLREGSTVATYAISIVDDDGELVCTARLTCSVRRDATEFRRSRPAR
ncbi:MAG: hotdog fold thioesterase [Actinobacteria bacterium]|nr:hotdog fold thioesterase [Actinomycetota bacterium]